jgi:uncharacterized membrane protein required for colicin V production
LIPTASTIAVTPADGVVILIVIADAYVGFRRGVSGEVVRLISLALAVVAGILLLRPLGSLCYYYTSTHMSEPHSHTFAFVATVVAAAVVRLVAQPFLHGWFDRKAPQHRNRTVGALAGTLHAAIGVVVVVVMVSLWAPSDVDRFFGRNSCVSQFVQTMVPEIQAQIRSRGSAASGGTYPASAHGAGRKGSLIGTLRERKHTPGVE